MSILPHPGPHQLVASVDIRVVVQFDERTVYLKVQVSELHMRFGYLQTTEIAAPKPMFILRPHLNRFAAKVLVVTVANCG